MLIIKHQTILIIYVVPFHVFLEYALFSTAINSVIHLWVPVMVGFLNSRRECVQARVHEPHLQIVALLGREAVQGHVGVELQDVLLQLVLLQLDSQAHKQSCASRTYNLALGERVKRGRNGRRVRVSRTQKRHRALYCFKQKRA